MTRQHVCIGLWLVITAPAAVVAQTAPPPASAPATDAAASETDTDSDSIVDFMMGRQDDSAASATQPVSPASVSQISSLTPPQVDRLVGNLSDPRWLVRQRAADELVWAGESAYPTLRAVYRRARSYDLRRRIRSIVAQNEYFKVTDNRGGYLGVSQQTVQASTRTPQIPPGQAWAQVNTVVPDTAAARAGLEQGDFITSIDDQPLKIGAGFEEFRNTIRRRAPGTKIRLGVMRGEEALELEAILGRQPLDNPAVQRFGDSQRTARAVNQFDAWWRREFDPAGAMDEARPASGDPRWTLEPADAP